MNAVRTPYRDPLATLHARQTWTVDALAAELTHAAAAVQAHERRVQQVRQRIDQTLRAFAACRVGAIDLAVEYRLRAYAGQLDQELVEASKQLEEASSLRETVRDQLVQARRLLDGYERHRERGREAHEHAIVLQAIKDADDAWLARRHAVEARHE